MNKILKKLLAFSLAGVIVSSLSINVFATEFIDMPNNWTTKALNNAVKYGLLYGEEAGEGKMKINPDDNITRAQMAAIIVRAFGATEERGIAAFIDADPNAWYYKELSKAVKMDAFRGDGNMIRPNNNITFQECFTVISQILRLDLYVEDTSCLDKFSDKDEIAQWAIPYAVAVVSNGYWDGIDGKLLPTTYITRSQFAVLMDNVVRTYIDEPGTYSSFEEGNVMIRANNVTIKDADVKGAVIVGDGVKENIVVDNSKLSKGIFVRGGGKTTKLQNKTYIQRAVLLMPNLKIQLDHTVEYPVVSGSIYTCYQTNEVEITDTLDK